MKFRCINLDWLEVYCLEPADAPRDVAYFTAHGYDVRPRVYGTPQYASMFTLYENEDEFIEIRRAPYSTVDAGGIFPVGACHLRLCNRTCYERDPIGHLRMFLVTHGYRFNAVSRIDIALDFTQFDTDAWTPRTFVAAYMRGDVAKVNQSRVAAHGRDYWANRIWNSLKWGSNSSAITTKLYNKTMELREAEDKPYIRDRWAEVGFMPTDEVWRIEFSATSQMQTLRSLKTGHTFKRDLTSYETRARLLFQFQVYLQRYFDFRQVIRNRDGTLKRKYECPALGLFSFADSVPWEPIRNVPKSRFVGRTYKILANKLKPLIYDVSLPRETRDAASIIFSLLMQRRAEECRDVETRREQEALQLDLMHSGISIQRLMERAAAMEDNERRLMYGLIRKYGITIQDDTLPF